MNQKKMKSMVIFAMLMLTTLAFASQAQATTFHAIWGKLYINGNIAEPGIKINLDVSKDPDNKYPTVITTGEITENGCNFYVGFENSKYSGATVSFNMVYRSQIYKVTLNKNLENVEQYFINMSYTNSPPNTPTNPNPSNGATNIATNNDLSWTCTDPDGDPLTYDVYFGTTNPPALRSTGQTGTTYDTGTMTEGTTYYWKITAKDPFSASTSSPIWSFTTQSSGGGGGGGGGSGGGIILDEPPVADANGPYTGFVGEEIVFDGTGSTGTLPLQFDWKFFDEDTWHNDIGPTPTHTYTEAGAYIVTLRVTNYLGNSTDTADVTILTGNNPPTIPTLTEYTTTGNKNVEYTYTAVSTDPDNDTITYTFDWGDGTQQTETDYLPNATEASVNHTWVNAGKYKMWVQAMDYYNATSEKTYLTILIDAINAGDIGYVTDDNGDGIYDTYHSNDGSIETITEKQADGTYLIDSDDDGNPDHILDPETGELTVYKPSSGEPAAQDNTIWYALLIGMIIAILVILLIFMATKKKKGKK